jgi:hypothetical protein
MSFKIDPIIIDENNISSIIYNFTIGRSVIVVAKYMNHAPFTTNMRINVHLYHL